MRVYLIPLRTELRNPAANLEQLRAALALAARKCPDLVCLPECTLTGYLYEEADFKRYAEPVPGLTTAEMASLARSFDVHLCFGLIEQAPTGVFDSAVLVDPAGRVCLVHRKIDEKPPFVLGTAVGSAETALGRLGILTCGDLFNPEVIAQLHPSLDVLLVPMSRSFDGLSPDPERWLREERQVYLDAAGRTGKVTLLVNALEVNVEGPAFGGAMIVSATGDLLAESPHGTDQPLILNL